MVQGFTVNKTLLLLVTPPAVTVTDPLESPSGTVAVIAVSDQLTTEAVRDPITTDPLPCVVPKPVPFI
jgi:hypothetical protein